MSQTVLVTGGAGFIGAHVALELLGSGKHVRVFDNLVAQVHGDGDRPAYLEPDVELIAGDLRDPDAVRSALLGVDSVVHLGARVGVGQSMYEIAEYTSVNVVGTSVLLEALMEHRVERLVVASSMSVYGEGLYADPGGAVVPSVERTRTTLERGQWDPCDPHGNPLQPLATPEWKPPSLSSVYALTKYDQEKLCLIFGAAYDVPTVALRFFNVYGPYQALSNPYTGVLAIFASRLMNDRRPLVFEDGNQRRDFVNVRDVARAVHLALCSEAASGGVFNVGSGESVSVEEVAHRLADVLNRTSLEPEITGKFRVGDIRHCFADISLARAVLGYEPRVDMLDGLEELATWVGSQAATDRVDDAAAELEVRGLTV